MDKRIERAKWYKFNHYLWLTRQKHIPDKEAVARSKAWVGFLVLAARKVVYLATCRPKVRVEWRGGRDLLR